MARPATEAELADLIRGATGPLSIRGGNTRGMATEGEPLQTDGLHGIRLYEPGALTLVAGAGTPIADIDTILGEKGQRLAFEPMDHRALMSTAGTPTIGGIAAANISGPRRIQTGAARDHMLGIRFVNGAGDIVRNGGRVMKNVTGYDLVKLIAGSHGTLGVLTEISLKVQAIPEAEATLVLRGQPMHDALADLTRAMGTPCDVSGAAWLSPEATGGPAERRIRIEGMSGSVDYRVKKLTDLLGADDIHRGPDSAALWREVRDVTPFAGQDGAVWRISTRPTVAAGICETLARTGLEMRTIADWSGGLLWLMTPDKGDAGAAAIRAQVEAHGGHATLIRAGAATRARVPVFHPQHPALDKLAAGLRTRFDPRSILNPGLMETS
ncbi:putative glycolate oxidase subunit protein [Pseudooceanicola batsensis HTCC2597]|uniref:Putative glycolate oxidase subunit protein n=1 Tax=Pseudooceanicola batsensis (strain ATCC BAA-863 / DSM 15984 / KCTC 12145 / HTCC2597) TaxID=252305 RepID=A3TWJ8_PSEBH|nr:FAD-binding protein [Pseudooceanicola batsensis]EAQ03994.1 putative glycolate oxidase subunit protein [Pseudooceanicola batsensis HTCC2597]